MERNVPQDGNKLDLGWKEMCLRMETNFALLRKEMCLWMERNLTWDEWVLTHMQISNVGSHGATKGRDVIFTCPN